MSTPKKTDPQSENRRKKEWSEKPTITSPPDNSLAQYFKQFDGNVLRPREVPDGRDDKQ